MKILKKVLLVIITLFINPSYSNSAIGDLNKLALCKRIGSISLFPEKSGMFYNDRWFYDWNNEKSESLFPGNSVVFPENINHVIVNSLLKSLENQYKDRHAFIGLPPLNPQEHLTGYMIEGW